MSQFISPSSKVEELSLISKYVSNCKTLSDTVSAAILVDHLEESQPNEKDIIWQLRQDISSMPFAFYKKKYQKNV